ncbi:hypothetical protein SBRY_90095 [Actinacidiphila bryophytorum]|uniref:Uncharacterized protein n=1 Tax=Actinacidiphila bryophytorum TaxID=1436133 RepID=A0A9W4H8J8_9ACTN|nr:hypothetical protein SBRY_90095 [Actinacidiphila bryophytorum]
MDYDPSRAERTTAAWMRIEEWLRVPAPRSYAMLPGLVEPSEIAATDEPALWNFIDVARPCPWTDVIAAARGESCVIALRPTTRSRRRCRCSTHDDRLTAQRHPRGQDRDRPRTTGDGRPVHRVDGTGGGRRPPGRRVHAHLHVHDLAAEGS